MISKRFPPAVTGQVSRWTFCAALLLSYLTGCAHYSAERQPVTPQTIRVTSDLTVHLYDAEADLQAAYMYQGGEADKIRKVKGFYSDRDNAIHCLKWDFHACGHELYHALQYKGSPPLTAEEGFEHFREGNYASE